MVEGRLAGETSIEIGEISAPVSQVHREYYKKEMYQHAETMEMSVMFCSDCHVIVTVMGGKSWRAKCKDGSMTRSMNFDVKVAKIGFEKQL
jgi:hypothetical protein